MQVQSFNSLESGETFEHMIRLEAIKVDPNAPSFAKPHPKQESIWHKQYADAPGLQAVVVVYPTAEEVPAAWRRGKCMGEDLARRVGMMPVPEDDDAQWFHQPFDDPDNQFAAGMGGESHRDDCPGDAHSHPEGI